MKLKGYAALSNRCGTKAIIHEGNRPFFYIDKRSFGSCCQAEHIKASCYGCWVSCVLKANCPLRGLNGIKLRSSLLGDLGSVVLFPIRHCDFRVHKQYVQRNQAEGETPPFFGTLPQV